MFKYGVCIYVCVVILFSFVFQDIVQQIQICIFGFGVCDFGVVVWFIQSYGVSYYIFF